MAKIKLHGMFARVRGKFQGNAHEERTVPERIEDGSTGSQDRLGRPHRTCDARSRLCSPEEVHLPLRLHRRTKVREADVLTL